MRPDESLALSTTRSSGTIRMATATSEIRAFTAAAFKTPQKFIDFCRNGGKPLGGVIDGEQVSGSMNVTFETIDPGSQEVLASICEMGEAEVHRAVQAADRAFYGNGGTGWRNLDVEDRIELVNKLVALCERDRDVLLACEIRDGGKVSELAEGDFTQIRACAEYFSGVARRIALGDGPSMQVAPLREGVHASRALGRRRGNHSLELSDRPHLVVHVPRASFGEHDSHQAR